MRNNYRDTIIRLTMQMNKINLKRFTKLFVMDGAEKEQTLIDICMAFIKINLKDVKLYVQLKRIILIGLLTYGFLFVRLKLIFQRRKFFLDQFISLSQNS